MDQQNTQESEMERRIPQFNANTLPIEDGSWIVPEMVQPSQNTNSLSMEDGSQIVPEMVQPSQNTNSLPMEDGSRIVPETIQPSQMAYSDESNREVLVSSIIQELKEMELQADNAILQQHQQFGLEPLSLPSTSQQEYPKVSQTVHWYPQPTEASHFPLINETQTQTCTDGAAVQNTDAQSLQVSPIQSWTTGNNSVSESQNFQWFPQTDSNTVVTSQNSLLHPQTEHQNATAPQYVHIGQTPGSNTDTAPQNTQLHSQMGTYPVATAQNFSTNTQMAVNPVITSQNLQLGQRPGSNIDTTLQNIQMQSQMETYPVAITQHFSTNTQMAGNPETTSQNLQMYPQTEAQAGTGAQYLEKLLQTSARFATRHQNLQQFPQAECNTAPQNPQGNPQAQTSAPPVQSLPHINFDEELMKARIQERLLRFSGTRSQLQSMLQQPPAYPAQLANVESQSSQFKVPAPPRKKRERKTRQEADNTRPGTPFPVQSMQSEVRHPTCKTAGTVWPQALPPASKRKPPAKSASEQQAPQKKATAKCSRNSKSGKPSETESSPNVTVPNAGEAQQQQLPIPRRVPQDVLRQLLQMPWHSRPMIPCSTSNSALQYQDMQTDTQESNVQGTATQQLLAASCSSLSPQTPYPGTGTSALYTAQTVQQPSSGITNTAAVQNLPFPSTTGQTGYHSSSEPEQRISASTWPSNNTWSSSDKFPVDPIQGSAGQWEWSTHNRAGVSENLHMTQEKDKCTVNSYPQEMQQESTISLSNMLPSQSLQITPSQSQWNVPNSQSIDKTVPMCSSSAELGESMTTPSLENNLFEHLRMTTHAKNFHLFHNTNPISVQQAPASFISVVSQGLQPNSLTQPTTLSLQMLPTAGRDTLQHSSGVLPRTSSSLLFPRSTVTQQHSKFGNKFDQINMHTLQVYSGTRRHAGCKYPPSVASQRNPAVFPAVPRENILKCPQYGQESSLNLPVSTDQPKVLGGNILTHPNPPPQYTQQSQGWSSTSISTSAAHHTVFGRRTQTRSNRPHPYQEQAQNGTSMHQSVSEAGCTVFSGSVVVPSKPPPPYPYPDQHQGWTSIDHSVLQHRPTMYGGTMFTPSKEPPPYPQQDKNMVNPSVSEAGGTLLTPLKPPPEYPHQSLGWTSTNVSVSEAHPTLFGGTLLTPSKPPPPYPYQNQVWIPGNPLESEANSANMLPTPPVSQPHPNPEQAQGLTPIDPPIPAPVNAPYTQAQGWASANRVNPESLQMDYEPENELLEYINL